MAEWLVGKASDIKEGDRKIVTAGKREIGVFHKGGAFYAYSNTCLHQGGPACEGMMIQNVVDVIDKDRPTRARPTATKRISSARGTATNTISRPANASATAS